MISSPAVALPRAFLTFIIITLLLQIYSAGKVLDLGDKLPELLEKHPEKRWLVKFYAPWCHHCQQLEPTYNNVAEKIYHKHDHLIVGRVDCSKYGSICEQNRVDAYPTIIYISKDNRVKYKGDRNEDSIVTFAERLNGPSINLVSNCDQLRSAIEKHKMIILSTFETDLVKNKVVDNLANLYKSDFWFYKFTAKPPNKCNNIDLYDESLLVLKQHLNMAIRFDSDKAVVERSREHDDNEEEEEDMQRAMLEWIGNESFPVYSPINSRNIERALATGKSLVLAILDEYKPARQIAPSSQEFHNFFEQYALKYAQRDDNYDKLLFGWTSDSELIEYITLTSVKPTPNVIVIASNFSYHLVVEQDSTTPLSDISKDVNIPRGLSEQILKEVISKLKKGELKLIGGITYTHAILSLTLGNFNKFIKMYRANPLLVSLIFGFPTIVILFVIYTTCCYGDDDDEKSRERLHSDDEIDDEEDDFEDDDDDERNEQRRLLSDSNHLKQD